MRKQYHFWPGRRGFDAWDVDRLVAAVEDAPIEDVPLAEIGEVDSSYRFDHGYSPTVRNVVEHCRLIQEADHGYPILLDPDGRVMDGMHRVARALLEGRASVRARRLQRLPEPDSKDRRPDEFPY